MIFFGILLLTYAQDKNDHLLLLFSSFNFWYKAII